MHNSVFCNNTFFVSSRGRWNRSYITKRVCGVCIVSIKGSSRVCMHVQACLFCWSALSRPWRSIIKTSARTAHSMEVQDLSGPGNTAVPGSLSLSHTETYVRASCFHSLYSEVKTEQRTNKEFQVSFLSSSRLFFLTRYYSFLLVFMIVAFLSISPKTI